MDFEPSPNSETIGVELSFKKSLEKDESNTCKKNQKHSASAKKATSSPKTKSKANPSYASYITFRKRFSISERQLQQAAEKFFYDKDTGLVLDRLTMEPIFVKKDFNGYLYFYSASLTSTNASTSTDASTSTNEKKNKSRSKNVPLIHVHMFAYYFVHGQKPERGYVIDHQDFDKCNNKWSNLRVLSSTQNLLHNPRHGRSPQGGQSNIKYNKKSKTYKTSFGNIHLGDFASFAEAQATVDEYKQKCISDESFLKQHLQESKALLRQKASQKETKTLLLKNDHSEAEASKLLHQKIKSEYNYDHAGLLENKYTGHKLKPKLQVVIGGKKYSYPKLVYLWHNPSFDYYDTSTDVGGYSLLNEDEKGIQTFDFRIEKLNVISKQ
jgi:hypothetical protein